MAVAKRSESSEVICVNFRWFFAQIFWTRRIFDVLLCSKGVIATWDKRLESNEVICVVFAAFLSFLGCRYFGARNSQGASLISDGHVATFGTNCGNLRCFLFVFSFSQRF